MKKITFCLIVGIVIVMFGGISAAQEGTVSRPADGEFVLRVFADSFYVRSLPTIESEPSASAVENDSLVAVGRNADGTWFQVRRPARDVVIGWVSRSWVAYTFDVARLPITDLTTGVTGTDPIVDLGVSVFVLTESTLRDRPSVRGGEIGIVPIMMTIPAIERTADNLWFKVNYLGISGWVAEFLVRPSGDLNSLPVVDLGFSVVALEIIPREVQLAQVQRLRDFITPLRVQADSTANFWFLLSYGENVPCNPPAGGYSYYNYTPRDVVELPELRRQTRNLNRAVDDLNDSLGAMQRCGVYTAEEISSAYAKALNSTALFDAVLRQLNNIEQNVIP